MAKKKKTVKKILKSNVKKKVPADNKTLEQPKKKSLLESLGIKELFNKDSKVTA